MKMVTAIFLNYESQLAIVIVK